MGDSEAVGNRFFQILARLLAGTGTLRVMLHRALGIRMGKKVWIGYGVILETSRRHPITPEDGVSLSMRVTVIAHFRESQGVRIEQDAFGAGGHHSSQCGGRPASCGNCRERCDAIRASDDGRSGESRGPGSPMRDPARTRCYAERIFQATQTSCRPCARPKAAGLKPMQQESPRRTDSV